MIFIYNNSKCTVTQENFNSIPISSGNPWNYNNVGPTTSDCYNLDNKTCLQYSNCGLCLKDNKSTCLPGDEQGPFFVEDCQKWAYTNFYDGRTTDDKQTIITPPWNTFYPIYEARYPSPISVSTLQ